MSYERFSRRRQNGYGIIITGYGSDTHYDQVGRDSYDAEVIRADNYRMMDEDKRAAARTLARRVNMSPMETRIAQQNRRIQQMTNEIREAARQSSISAQYGSDGFGYTRGFVTTAGPTMDPGQDLAPASEPTLTLEPVVQTVAPAQTAMVATRELVATAYEPTPIRSDIRTATTAPAPAYIVPPTTTPDRTATQRTEPVPTTVREPLIAPITTVSRIAPTTASVPAPAPAPTTERIVIAAPAPAPKIGATQQQDQSIVSVATRVPVIEDALKTLSLQAQPVTQTQSTFSMEAKPTALQALQIEATPIVPSSTPAVPTLPASTTGPVAAIEQPLYLPAPPVTQKAAQQVIQEGYKKTYEAMQPLQIPAGYLEPAAPGLTPLTASQPQKSNSGLLLGAGVLALLAFLR